ncbi:Hypothetical protein HVR_LOCUS625 [uncultured virus]|nr:Hypothetical protein HVR_LOCUS625 [uncultured virus]
MDGCFKFIVLFVITLPISYSLDYFISLIFPDKFISFTILHIFLIPFLRFNKIDLLWLFLTYTHGLAHIFYPALYGTTFNENYTPIYDYLVHAAQCLCVYNYNPDYFPLGIMIHSSMLLGAIISHLDRKFLETLLWVAVSSGGVFGTHYHMMLLNINKDNNIHTASMIIWTAPYLGYLYMKYIPVWDSILNIIGLFRLWYFHFFFVNKLIHKF